MVKYTVTEEMNLPELIEWAWENDVKNKYYYSGECYADEVYFDANGGFHLKSYFIAKSQTFSVEVEKVIDADTTFNHLLLMYRRVDDVVDHIFYEQHSIREVLRDSGEMMSLKAHLSISYIDDSGIPHLIWHDGKVGGINETKI